MKKIILLIFTLCLLFYGSAVYDMDTVYAADDDELELQDGVSEADIIELHKQMDSVLHVDNGWLYQDVIRSVGWYFLEGIIWIVNYIEDGVNGILTWNNFYESSGVGKLMKQLTPFIIGLFLLALVYLGFQFITNKIDKREEVMLNVLMAFSLIFLVPALMPYMDKVLQVGVDQMKGEDKLKLSEALVKQNVADVKYYVDSDFAFGQLGLPVDKTAKGKQSGTTDYSHANKVEGTKLNITEKLDLQSEKGWFGWWSSGYKKKLEENNPRGHDFLMTQTVYQGDGNKVRLKALASNKIPTTSLGQESYYRYHINWGTLIFSFLVIGVALAITVIKMARVIFDLGFHAIFSMFVAATDLSGGQRTKKVVTEIVSSFAVLFVMVLILKLFTLYVNWVTGLSGNVGGIIVVLMLVAGAWALIDAPDIVQRILGIDAGLRSGWQAMMGAFAGTKLASGLGKGVGKAAMGTARAGISGVALAKGMAGINPMKAAGQHIKPMPPGGGFQHGQQGGHVAGDKESPQDMPKSEGSSDVGGQTVETAMPSQTPGTEGATRPQRDTTHNPSMPTQTVSDMEAGPMQIDPQDNPYQGFGLRSGSQMGQQTANMQARAYNTGAQIRSKVANAGKAVGAAAMGSARFMASPIRSSQNIAAVAGATMTTVASSVGQQVKAMPKNMQATAGRFVSRVNTPLASTPNSITSTGTATTAAVKAMPTMAQTANVISGQKAQAQVQQVTSQTTPVSSVVASQAVQQAVPQSAGMPTSPKSYRAATVMPSQQGSIQYANTTQNIPQREENRTITGTSQKKIKKSQSLSERKNLSQRDNEK